MSKNLADFLNDVMAHAKKNPAKRQEGMPAEESATNMRPALCYQRLPERLRYGFATVYMQIPGFPIGC